MTCSHLKGTCCNHFKHIERLAKGGRLPLVRRGMPMGVKDALTLVISFGALFVALLTLTAAIVAALNHKK